MNRLLLLSVLLLAATGSGLSGQVVVGLVVDSLWQAPLPGATVHLLQPQTGKAVAAVESDQDGVFALRAPAAGTYRLRVRKEGFRSSTFPEFTVGADERVTFQLLTSPIAYPLDPAPLSTTDFMEGLCPAGVAPSGDRAILGVIYDAEQRPVSQATIQVTWPALPGAMSNAADSDASAIITADSSGFYLVCGVPVETPLKLAALQDDRVSDLLELRFDSAETVVNGNPQAMPYPFWRQDFELLGPAERTAAVAGVILNGETGEPVPGAVVEIAGTNLSGESDATGSFVVASLPAGPGRVVVRAPGRRPWQENVVLTRDDTLRVNEVRLVAAAAELAPINVEGAAPETRRPMEDFLRRRAGGAGDFIMREEFEKSHPRVPTDILKRLRGVRVYPNPTFASTGQRWVVTMTRGRSRTTQGTCPPLYFLDGVYVGDANLMDVDVIVGLEEIMAVEAYASTASLPQEFNRPGAVCGVISFWTR